MSTVLSAVVEDEILAGEYSERKVSAVARSLEEAPVSTRTPRTGVVGVIRLVPFFPETFLVTYRSSLQVT